MYDADAGFFHLTFANPDDDYFTETYLKMSCASFLRLSLIEEGYRYLCFIEKTPFGSKHDYRVTMAGGMDRSMLDQPVKESKFLKVGRLFGGADRSKDQNAFEKKSSVNVHGNTLRKYLFNILNHMSRKKYIAVICPVDIFAECCENEDLLKAFILRQKSPNHNIMILTSTVDAADNDKYFEGLAVQDPPGTQSIFSETGLFPNIEKMNRRSSKLPKLVFTYSYLKEVFKGRMELLNELSYENIKLIVRYTVLHNFNLNLEYPSEYYAAVVFAWYENEVFRSRYEFLNLPDNPFFASKPVRYAVSHQGFYDAADRVIGEELDRQEGLDADALAEFWQLYDQRINIVYDSSELPDRCPEIYNCLIQLRKSLKGRDYVLEDSDYADIDMMISYFGRPSYSLYGSAVKLPHEWIKDYRSQINELFISLKKDVWNSWDENAARLMFVIFTRCYEHTKETEETTEDRDNYLGELEFKKCMEAIDYCRQNSVSRPNDRVSAHYFFNETKRVLCCENPHSVKIYRIGD